MKQCVVLSGKGGTGKTTVCAGMAWLAAKDMKLVLADADVDAANLGLLLDPEILQTHDFVGGKIARIKSGLCANCGICEEVCRFDAISAGAESYLVDPTTCEGCAACVYQCPEQAIQMYPNQDGQWFHSQTEIGPLYHAHLFAGQENSGKLVNLIKEQARLLAKESEADLLLVDGPPGIGCPVISACSGMDLALLVVEPTLSGEHDLERILATTQHFKVPAIIAINKADINLRRAQAIEDFCKKKSIPFAGRIPFDTAVTESVVAGEPITKGNGPAARAVGEVWAKVHAWLDEERG